MDSRFRGNDGSEGGGPTCGIFQPSSSPRRRGSTSAVSTMDSRFSPGEAEASLQRSQVAGMTEVGRNLLLPHKNLIRGSAHLRSIKSLTAQTRASSRSGLFRFRGNDASGGRSPIFRHPSETSVSQRRKSGPRLSATMLVESLDPGVRRDDERGAFAGMMEKGSIPDRRQYFYRSGNYFNRRT